VTGFYPSDLYGFSTLLSEDELQVLGRLRTVLEQDVQPLLADYWERGEFPEQIIKPLVDLNLMEPAELTRDGAVPGGLYGGFRNFELARTDASVATFYNAQSGLFRTAVNLGGSPEQAAEWVPLIQSFRMSGVFALTEPGHGSDIGGGLVNHGLP
jgi:glutaryl-CoA dehydrogenase